ncbi:hypothetical protein ACFQ2B_12275 [Streptomyces stramineus]
MVHAGPVDGGGFRLAGVLPYGTKEAREETFVDAADDFRGQSGAVPLATVDRSSTGPIRARSSRTSWVRRRRTA